MLIHQQYIVYFNDVYKKLRIMVRNDGACNGMMHSKNMSQAKTKESKLNQFIFVSYKKYQNTLHT